ncbi:unnamed protein product [Brassica oleracea]|uniref:ENTH domain-containing protein n=2 Tax=Brassica TaxID=3705 RepID=A0A3P6G591_BRAOL|nr:unnamed protein product [Brassica napus]VDD55466.1 unnamed protein product [Brassica oleracea]
MGKFTTLSGKLKDRASQMKLNVVYLCSSVNTKNIDEAILKATTHTSNKPPSDKYVKFLQSTMATCYCPQTISGIVQRLCVTTDVCVASKCLILIHNMIKSEKGYEGEDGHRGTNSHRNLIYNQGESNLKLDDLNVGSSCFTIELVPWVQWYKKYLNIYLCIAEINARPDTSMERPNIIVIRMIGLMEQDYVSVIRLIKIRFEELDKRTADPAEMIPVLVRLDKCRESLSEFCWRCEPLDKEFWDLVLKLKAN